MSYKTFLIKKAVKWTPKTMVLWVANIVLKDFAEMTDFSCDLDTHKVYVQTKLLGESETIDVWLEDFTITHNEGSYQFILNYAKSNKPWLENLFARVTGKFWELPIPPQYDPYAQLLVELLASKALENNLVLPSKL